MVAAEWRKGGKISERDDENYFRTGRRSGNFYLRHEYDERVPAESSRGKDEENPCPAYKKSDSWCTCRCFDDRSVTEQQRNNLRSVDTFREQLLITSGFSEPLYDLNGQKFLERAKSISFAKMDEPAFNEVYSRCLDTILTILMANGITEDEFNNILQNYS